MTGRSTVDKASALRRLGYGCLLLAFACFPGGTSWAQGPAPALIAAPPVYPGAVNTIPNAVAMGDFNGDGLLDFAVVEYNPNAATGGQIEIFMGQADGSFKAGNVYPVGTLTGQPNVNNHTIAVGLFNGPTQPRGIAVAVNEAVGCPSGGVVFFFGNGDGTFQASTCLANASAITSLAVADFNNDGFDDIAVSNASGAAAGSVTVYLNNAVINTGPVSNSFYNYASYSAVLPGNGGATLYGTIVAGNINGQNGTSLALLASTGPFTQYVSVFENEILEQQGVFFRAFVPPQLPLAAPPNGFSDIALADFTGTGIAALVGISTQGLQYSVITNQTGVSNPQLGAFNGVSRGPLGLAMTFADFDGNGIPDLAYLDTNLNLNIDLNPGATSASNIGPFGPKGYGIAAGLSTGLNKWVVVDAGIDQPLNPFFAPYNAARSIAVYLVDRTTGQPEIAPLYAQSPTLTTLNNTITGAFAVADFNGVGVPDVAVLGANEASFNATVSIFQNAYKTATPRGYATPPTVVDLGVLLGLPPGSPSGGGSSGYALVAGSFRNFDPDLALVTSQGITLLENQGANTQGPFNFTLAPNCQGFFGAPATPPNNCYLENESHFPGLSFSSKIRPPIIAADMNGDGIQDIVVAFPENCNAGGKSAIYVLISNGDGTFQPPIYIASPVVNPVGLAAGKLLGSSLPDLVVVNGGEVCSGTQAVTGAPTFVGAAVIPNNGAGGFGTPTTIFSLASDVALPSVSTVAVADMNTDGLPDVVISAADGLHALLNTPANPQPFTDQGAVPLYGPTDIITNAAQIDIADLNKDGTLDVAAAIGGIVYIFPGDGKGGLSTPVQAFAAGPDSNQIRAIDVNGDGTVDVLVNNSLGFSVLVNGSASTGPTTLTITAPPLVAGTVGVPYGPVQFLATGGGGQFTFTVSPSMLAGGLSLTTTGLLSGTPTQAGTFPFTVSASDTNGDTGSQTFSLTIASATLPPPNITSVTPNFGPAAGGETVTVTGRSFQNGTTVLFGSMPATSVTFVSITSLSVVVPPLLAGSTVDVLVRNPDGQSAVLAGGFVVVAPPPPPVSVMVSETITVADTPTFPDVFDAETIHVQDTASVRAYAPLVISPVGPLLPGVVNNPYPSVTFTAIGGAGGPLVLTESGSIPGIGFVTGAGSLTLSGTPTAASSGYTFSITVTDALGDSATQNHVLGISAACQSITVSPSSPLVAATVGSIYQQQFSQAGAVGNVTWPATGTLPPGLTLSASGLLSGIPTIANTYAFSIIATDQNGCSSGATQESLTVNLPALPSAIVSIAETIKVNDAVSFPDVFDQETIHVNDQVSVVTLQSIAVTPANPTIAEGATQQFTAIGTFSDGSTQNLTSSVTWSSSSTAVATMSGNTATAATGHTFGTLGTSTITAKLGGTLGSTILTVNSHLSVTSKLKSVTLAGNGNYVVTISVTNNGDISASAVIPGGFLGTKLDVSSTPALNVAPGATATVTLVFPSSAGRPGTKQNLSVAGLATGTNPNGTPVLPAAWVLQPTPTQVTLP
jgi:IPT/TIG domain/Bacterial Ig-like domain (group 2)/Putative Ig domain/FG-GAP-like repeat